MHGILVIGNDPSNPMHPTHPSSDIPCVAGIGIPQQGWSGAVGV